MITRDDEKFRVSRGQLNNTCNISIGTVLTVYKEGCLPLLPALVQEHKEGNIQGSYGVRKTRSAEESKMANAYL